ncbi:TetR/AcrR family transcriptional regulator [Flavobacterium saliperosum]|uniref:Transcriptional regulator, TetR family n=3 Tax=Flavobacterium saliperosum TaxID=329186 RepID=A0A1G4VY40_9FLAO|nr:TetR/AcrR family transcriptional regulator [Flavobacterium saliperosum]SCX13721.1 transcriptional regulator, TetR family [Flavobacterium saliperosum]
MKNDILQKASDMFLSLGFKSVTMDDIANELGISKKTIYQHYATKDDLVQATTLFLFENISSGIDEICAIGKNPIEELFEIKEYVLHNLKNEDSSPFYQLQKFYPKIYATLKCKQFDKLDSCVIQNLKRGIALELYRKEIDLEFIGRIYYSGINSLKDIEIFPENMFKMRNLQENFLEYHLRGIITEKGLSVLQQFITKHNQ